MGKILILTSCFLLATASASGPPPSQHDIEAVAAIFSRVLGKRSLHIGPPPLRVVNGGVVGPIPFVPMPVPPEPQLVAAGTANGPPEVIMLHSELQNRLGWGSGGGGNDGSRKGGPPPPPPNRQYGPPPQQQYGPPPPGPAPPPVLLRAYGTPPAAPNQQYGPPPAQFAPPPQQQYGPPPQQQYGAPAPPPPPQQQYGPPPAPPPSQQYGAPAPPPNQQYGPPPAPNQQYGAPAPPPSQQYGAPAPPPSPQYGAVAPAPPPNQEYGAPAPPPSQQYGAPAPAPAPEYGAPAAPPSQEYGPPKNSLLGGHINNIKLVEPENNDIDIDNGGYSSPSGFSKNAKIYKHVYIHTPPHEPEEDPEPRVIRPNSKQDTHYNIIFVKAPTPPKQQQTEVVLPPDPIRKTLVYVLVKKPERPPEIKFRPAKTTSPPKPEVYFIRYKGNKQGQGGYDSVPDTDSLLSQIGAKDIIRTNSRPLRLNDVESDSGDSGDDDELYRGSTGGTRARPTSRPRPRPKDRDSVGYPGAEYRAPPIMLNPNDEPMSFSVYDKVRNEKTPGLSGSASELIMSTLALQSPRGSRRLGTGSHYTAPGSQPFTRPSGKMINGEYVGMTSNKLRITNQSFIPIGVK